MLTLKAYYLALTPSQKTAFAKMAGTNTAYLSHIVNGHRSASPRLARRLHEASGFTVALHSIRPDIWADGKAA